MPLIGFLLDRAVLANDTTVSLAGWTKPAAEPEIAIELARDVSEAAGEREIARAIGAVGPAIELADVDGPVDDVESILAGDIFQRHVIFGPRQPIDMPGGLSKLTGQVTLAGRILRCLPIGVNTGRLLEILQQVAATLAAFGEKLRAGDVVIAGSTTPPLMLGPGDELLRWELRPIGVVAVRFAG